MSSAKEQTKRILEYIAFFETNISVYFESDYSNGMPAKIVAVQDLSFNIRTEQQLPSQGSKSFLVILPYKGKALNFRTIGTSLANEMDNCSISLLIPDIFSVSERRGHNRIGLRNRELKLTYILEQPENNADLIRGSDEVLHISSETIALSPKGDDTFFKIGTCLRDIRVMKDTQVILETTGTVTRVYNQKLYDRKVIVIHLSKPSGRPRNHADDERRPSNTRFDFGRKSGAFVEFQHPIFADRKIFGDIIELSTSGISFTVKNCRYPFMIGMYIQDLSIQLPCKSRHQTKFRITTVEHLSDKNSGEIRIGGEIVMMPVSYIKDVSTEMSKSYTPDITEATQEDYSDLWEFLFETGFIYRSKQNLMKQNAPQIQNTLFRILSYRNSMAKVVLYKSDNDIKGHISTIRLFDRTWLIQHLTAKPTADARAAGKAMVDSMSAFFWNARSNDAINSKYIVVFYRPDNIYPATIFSNARQIINDDNVCASYVLRFCVSISRSYSNGTGNAQIKEIISDRDPDLKDLRKILASKENLRLASIEDLDGEKIINLEISKEYEKLGLYRYRRIFRLKCIESNVKVFGICNYASPGMNLSELTNSFQFFSNVDDKTMPNALIDQLTEYILKTYVNTLVKNPVLLLRENQYVPVQFNEEKKYILWWFDIQFVDRFKTATDAIFMNLKKFIRSRNG